MFVTGKKKNLRKIGPFNLQIQRHKNTGYLL